MKTYHIQGLLKHETWYRVDVEVEADSEDEALGLVNESEKDEVRCEDTWLEGPVIGYEETEEEEDDDE